MPTVEKKVKIQVQATRTALGKYDFKMIEDQGNGVKVERKDLVFSKNADQVYEWGWYKVEFELDDGGTDLQFHEDEDEVFWIGPPVAGGDKRCPEDYSAHPPITHKRLNDKKIRVKNPDRKEEELAFTLGFQEGSNPQPIRYDPGWGNKNGGMEASARQLLVAGASLIGAAALIGWALTAARPDRHRRGKRR
jgi:hypothetical protein